MGKSHHPLTSDELQTIRAILPSYDLLPDLLTTKELARLIRFHPHAIANDRTTFRRLDIPYLKIARNVAYPKVAVGRYLLRNVHGGDWGEEVDRGSQR